MRHKPALHIIIAATVLLSLPSCKETTHVAEYERDGEVYIAAKSPDGDVAFYADSQYQLKENSKFFFAVYNETFTTKLTSLPKSGAVEAGKQPNSGHWYPERSGGTNVVVDGNQTPLEKYDQAYNGAKPLAEEWEREKHSKNGSWYGHCNGYSAATQRYPTEPSKSVDHNGVTFSPKDIKALMAEMHMSADFIFLGGGRCETNDLGRPTTRQDPTEMGICEDINPGTMHAALANWIGRMKHTVIMDQFGGEEVWNYPYFKYDATYDFVTKAQALQAIGAGGGDYVFNPAATKFARVSNQVVYANATGQEVLDHRKNNGTSDDKVTFLEYILELDSEDRIIGGEWIGQSQAKHPDFLWIALPPLEPNGTEYMSNPHVKHDEVIKLWAKSTGNDPDNPPQDIVRPAPIETWGRFPDFEVTLDGSQRGAVFLGKPITMRVKRKGDYDKADVKVAILHNGEELTTLEGPAGKDLTYDLKPGLGINRLRLSWNQDDKDLGKESLMYLVVR